MELPNHAKQLLLQLNQQRAKGFLCDVIIVVENALFRAHKNILAASSIYFKSLVLHDNLINLDTEMVNPSVFRQVLDFIYTGKLLSSSDQSNEQNFSALLTAASYLQLHDLAALCRKRLKRSGGKPLPGKPSTPGLRDKLSDDEMFVCSSGKHGGNGSSNGNLSSGGSAGEPDLGLDLSKKSPPSAGTATDALSPHSNSQESPQSASVSTTNSASLDDSSTTLPGVDNCSDPTEVSSKASEDGPLQPDGPPPQKKSRQGSRKNEWPRREASGLKSEDHDRPLVNGVIVGPKDRKGGGHRSTNYVYRQEGFEPALGDNLYVCIPCGKGFPSSEQLNAHVETHTEDELYIKEEGGHCFGSETRPFKCTVCSKSYKDPATLRPFPCNICGKMFTQRGTMTRHMRSHLGLKPFACEECGMRFTRQYRLTEHMRVHSGEKPYECQLCGGKFTQQRNLISHLRMHTSPS
uniref:Hypermethylated in cancer 2 protein n=1 Tax=Neogobius melanostomus TaxID=47308 RepID=A0A8C6SC14_9GOBI